MTTYTPQPKERLYTQQQVHGGVFEAVNTLPLLGLLTAEGKRAIVDHISTHMYENLPKVIIPGWNDKA